MSLAPQNLVIFMFLDGIHRLLISENEDGKSYHCLEGRGQARNVV